MWKILGGDKNLQEIKLGAIHCGDRLWIRGQLKVAVHLFREKTSPVPQLLTALLIMQTCLHYHWLPADSQVQLTVIWLIYENTQRKPTRHTDNM